ncbi:MAG TPA: ATP-binding protein [Clostridiales bacterium]|nr:ATP-binding protein [Clostridiales bacterium]
MAIKNDQYNQIIREYDNKQFNNKFQLDKRREEVFKRIPTLKNLEDEMITLAASSGRSALFGDDTKLKELKEATSKLMDKQNTLLANHGYPLDYLLPQYECDKCHDTGFIGNDKCNCFKQAIADLIYDASNIRQILDRENFKQFSFDYYSDDYIDETTGLSPRSNMQKTVALSKSFIRHFDKEHDNLLFMGNTGVGKTFLANCIAKELLDLGRTVIYLTSFRLFDILEKNKFGKNIDDAVIVANQFDYILDCDLLIIDDLGTELNNSFITSQLYLIINERLLRQKATLISTNLSLENLNTNYSERVYSRIISSYTICRIFGEDIRLHKAINNL